MMAAIMVTPVIHLRLGSFDELEQYNGFASHGGILGASPRAVWPGAQSVAQSMPD